MNIVDSSAWLSYFADEPSSGNFLTPIQDKDSLIVPVITIYEVFKVVLSFGSFGDSLFISPRGRGLHGQV